MYSKLTSIAIFVFVCFTLAFVSCKNNQSTFVDPRDGNEYTAVKVGNQVWMAENINFKTLNSWCYDENETNCQEYGRLYTWHAALKVCPKGWRLPSNKDWEELVKYTGGEFLSGDELKSKHGWGNKRNGKDSYGFRALPGGSRYYNGEFKALGKAGNFWSSTSNSLNQNFAWKREVQYDNDITSRFSGHKDFAYSVRCIKNQ